MQPHNHPAGPGHPANPNVAALGATSESVQQGSYPDYTHVPGHGSPDMGSHHEWSVTTSQPRIVRSLSMSTDSTATSYTSYSSTFSAAAESQGWTDQTSVPPAEVQQPVPWVYQPHVPATNGTHRADEILWCEGTGLLACDATFALDNCHDWIKHHFWHLGNGNVDAADFPHEMWCWFCNDLVFVVDDPRDGYTCFTYRMEHIRQHILDDPRLTADRMRPDFHMVMHLYGKGLVSDELYQAAMSFTEIPMPGDPGHASSSAGSSSARPLGHRPRWPASQRADVQVHDLEKEKREERRRRQKKNGKAPATATSSEKRRK